MNNLMWLLANTVQIVGFGLIFLVALLFFLRGGWATQTKRQALPAAKRPEALPNTPRHRLPRGQHKLPR